MKEELIHIINSAYQDGAEIALGNKEYKFRQEELADAAIEVFKKDGYKLFLMNQATIMGRSIDEIVEILHILDIERLTDMKMTYKNLQKYVDLMREDMRKAQQRAMKSAIDRVILPTLE